MSSMLIGPVAHCPSMGPAVASTADDAEVPTEGASVTATDAPVVGLESGGAPEEQPGTMTAKANSAATLRNLKVMKTSFPEAILKGRGGRYWTRTSDFLGVSEAL